MTPLADAAAGLRRAGGDLLATLLDAADTRLELAALEFEEAQQRLTALLAHAVLALLLLDIGALLGAGWLVLCVAPEYRVAVLGMLAAGFLAAASVAWQLLRRRLRGGSTLLQATRAELRRDVVALRAEARA